MGCYLLKDAQKTGTGDLLVSVQAMDPIRIPFKKEFEDCITALWNRAVESREPLIDKEINNLVYALYGLSKAEMSYVADFVTQFR